MGSGIVGTQCTCSHLTVFAIAMRFEQQLAPLCHASEVDYVLIVLFALLAVVLVAQIARLLHLKLSKVSAAQHSLLLLACILRLVFLVAKPVIGSLAGLVILGLLPSAISLSLLIHPTLIWVSLQTTTSNSSAFAKFRAPFVVLASGVFALIILMTALVAASEPNTQMPRVLPRHNGAVFRCRVLFACSRPLAYGWHEYLSHYRSILPL